MSVEIKTLTELDAPTLKQIITGYTSDARYVVNWLDSDTKTAFTLELVSLATPYVKHYPAPDDETFGRYREMLHQELSFGAYDGEQLVGLALAEFQRWNGSVWVWELHVAENQRGRGIGRALMECVTEASRAQNARVIVCETQTTNIPAIRFYRKMGFKPEGIDISHYSNTDWPDGEVAVFMKRRL